MHTDPRLCLVVADAGRARLYSFDRERARPGDELREHVDLVNPDRKVRHAALSSGIDDGRDQEPHQHDVDKRFAGEIAKHLAALLAETHAHHAVIVASPNMLGLLRATAIAPPGVELTELARDLTHESTPRLHDHLAQLDILPARARSGAAG